MITFFALKIIFIDIFIAIGDLSTDFWQVSLLKKLALRYVKIKARKFSPYYCNFIYIQGIELLFREGLHSYGWIIIAVNWVPGLVASMHIIHMYRTKLPAKKTLLYTGRFCIYV